MKIQFVKTTSYNGDTQRQNNVSSIIVNGINNAKANDDILNEIFGFSKSYLFVKSEIQKDIEVATTEALKLEIEARQPTIEQSAFGSKPIYDYKIHYAVNSIVYECLQFFPDNNYLLLDEETNKIFTVKKSDNVEVFLVRDEKE